MLAKDKILKTWKKNLQNRDNKVKEQVKILLNLLLIRNIESNAFVLELSMT